MKLLEAEDEVMRLCALYRVPMLSVAFTYEDKKEEFDADNYIIYVGKKTTKIDLRHEFYHYLLFLIRRSHDLEEDLCNIFAQIDDENA